MKLIASKNTLNAIGLAVALSVIGTSITQAQVNGPPENVTTCKEIQFFDKIFFKVKKDIYDKKYKLVAHKDDLVDIKVPDRLDELANLKAKIVDFFRYYGYTYVSKDDIEIIDVDLAAVCVKSVTEKDVPPKK
ncbi:MAG: hypothetical protein M3Z21_12805 [Pseudomonadota bacterium]|nr:hypothetical protein [Pseudomonadota bacterium]